MSAPTPVAGDGCLTKHTDERLTRRDREIMSVIFAPGNRAWAEDIRARLTHPPSSSSVRVMPASLEPEGLSKHQKEWRRHIYLYLEATSPAAVKRV